jgi:hypothetical protein
MALWWQLVMILKKVFACYEAAEADGGGTI